MYDSQETYQSSQIHKTNQSMEKVTAICEKKKNVTQIANQKSLSDINVYG